VFKYEDIAVNYDPVAILNAQPCRQVPPAASGVLVERFVDLIVRRRGAMAVFALRVAAWPSSGFLVLLGFAFGEGCGLSFVDALDLLELRQETSILAFQFGNAAIAFAATDADRDDHTAPP
jgi:hypothetical protein